MKTAGKLLMFAGLGLFLYSTFLFDPSLPFEQSRVVNLQLLNLQQNMTIGAGALAVVGAVLFGFGARNSLADEARERHEAQQLRANEAQLSVDQRVSEAIRTADLAELRTLLSSRAMSAQGTNRNGRGWLQLAVLSGQPKVAALLLEHGADPDARDGLLRSAREEASQRDDSTMLQLLGGKRP